MLPETTELSTKKKVGDWRDLQPTLDAAASPAVWTEVISDYFFDRIRSRYLDPIEFIQKNGKGIGEGFAMVSLQCALIEFLESTVQGVNFKHRGAAPPYEYERSQPIFVSFLVNRAPFSEEFDGIWAQDYYVSVRCGLLHEARTKGTWLIHETSPNGKVLNKTVPIFYRNDFQRYLGIFISAYATAVPTDPMLQQAFRRKFNHLCGLPV